MAPQPPSPRKRGAQKGNHNAYKHGFYANRPKVKEPLSPNNAAGLLQPDIDLFRTVLARVTASMSDPNGPPLTHAENLAALQVVYISVARLNGLWHTNARLFSDGNNGFFAALRRLGFNEKELDAGNFIKPKSRRGGRTGNTNALKYGLYTRVLPTEEAARLEAHQDTTIEDELALMRVMLLRVSMSLKANPDLDFRTHLRTLNLINNALGVIVKLERSKKMAFTMPDPAVMDQYLQEVHRLLSSPEFGGQE